MIRTDEQGRDYYVDGRAIKAPLRVCDWRFLWLRHRTVYYTVAWKPFRHYVGPS